MELSILDLTAEKARRFLLKQESFCNIGLPQYFNFQNLLDNLNIILDKYKDERSNSNILKSDIWCSYPGNYNDVNYRFLQNKDGSFSWRPIQIINPVIYAYLIKEITEENNWETILERFKELHANDKIKCSSIPLVNHSVQTDSANTILNWWNTMEQQSIELALKYNYMMKTDISDCYGSIYTHSITWAMCDKEKVKEKLITKKQLSAIDEKR